MTGPDIMDRLRLYSERMGETKSAVLGRLLCEAADEIERLRRNTGCARNQRSTQFCAEALDAQREVARLTAERDEARRSCCEYAAIVDGADNTEGMESGRFHEVAMRYMKERNWDCFKEDDK
jgi:hypothetical protein